MGVLFEFAALFIILCTILFVLWKLVTAFINRPSKKSGSTEQPSSEQGQKRKSEL